MTGGTHRLDTPLSGADADEAIAQNRARYTAEDHATWDKLFADQAKMLPGRASGAYLRGLDLLKLGRPGIPDFDELSGRLMQLTGWQVVAVSGLVPDEVFFDHLANRRLIASTVIRRIDQLDSFQEADVFRDVFGHAPMLADPVFADYLEAYGRAGLRAIRHDALRYLRRLYWHTTEFGLIEEPEGLRIYGAGIISSVAESRFALDDPSPNRIRFDLKRVMRTQYRIDDFQQNYFVIPSFDELLRVTVETDFAALCRQIAAKPAIRIGHLMPDDAVITTGTQEYAKGRRQEAVLA